MRAQSLGSLMQISWLQFPLDLYFIVIAGQTLNSPNVSVHQRPLMIASAAVWCNAC